jgi:hypothetical protein
MAKDFDISGVWESTYRYKSDSQKGRQTGRHKVRLFRMGNDIVIQSQPDTSGSYLFLRLTLNDQFLTGTWHEYTAPGGHYKGATYYGAIQFKLEPGGQALKGKWIGFGRRGHVKSDDWEITRITQS